ncbi:MAG: sensor histidine kinase [Chloroflexi bacterium]|nr:MAG: sensor histidine kinase [Chloroflexota bacterium]
MTFRTKLVLWYSSLLVGIVVLVGAAVFAVVRWTLINSIDDTLEETAREVIANIYEGPGVLAEFGGAQTLIVPMPELDIFRASNVYVQAWDSVQDGTPRLAASSDNLADFRTALDFAAVGKPQTQYSDVLIHGTEVRVLSQPVFFGDRLFGTIQVGASLETLNQATERLIGIMAVSLGIAVIGSVALGMWLSSRALKPIENITEAATKIANADDLSTRLPWDGPQDELGRLISVFNNMMERLEDLFKVQQRFVADVSHELRTPLTSVRGNLDLIKRYGMDTESLEAIESETHRMTRMVEDLLLLAKADYGGLTLELEPLDLDTVFSEVYRDAWVLAKDRRLEIKISDFEPVRVMGHGDRIKQLLLNLIGNAIKFTPDDGRITLSLQRVGNHAIIVVQDTGIGIAPEDLEHIFDRFYQADESRARMSDGESAGLGLAIAQWIVDAHGGTIRAESQPGRGSRFIVTLPVLQDDAPQIDYDDEADMDGGRYPRRSRNFAVGK